MGALLGLAVLGVLILGYAVAAMVLLERLAKTPAAAELQAARLDGRAEWPFTTAA